MGCEPFGVVELLVAHEGLVGDFGLEDILYEILGLLALDDELTALVGNDVDVVPLVTKAGVGDFMLDPVT